MPVNLLKLPSLVCVLVVSELDYQEIFLLSLCSRRSNRLVKKARIKVPRLTFQFGKCDGKETFVIGVVTDLLEWFYVTSVLHVPRLNLEGVANVKPEPEYEPIIKSWYEEDGSFRHRIERANEPMAVQKESQDHINSIFHYTGTYKLYLSMQCEGRLPNITNVKYIDIEDGTIDSQFLTNLLTTYPDPDTVESRIVGNLPKDSPLFQIENIAVHSRCGPDYFHNFVGRNMWLRSVALTEQDLIQFLKKWISNEAYHNLETFTISVTHPLSINPNLIRQAIEFEEYDPNEPEKRPENYFCVAPFNSLVAIEEFPLRNTDVVEIKRTTDGKKAFLSIYPTRVELLIHKC